MCFSQHHGTFSKADIYGEKRQPSYSARSYQEFDHEVSLSS